MIRNTQFDGKPIKKNCWNSLQLEDRIEMNNPVCNEHNLKHSKICMGWMGMKIKLKCVLERFEQMYRKSWMKHISHNVKRDFKPFPILFGSFKYMDKEEILSMWNAVQNPFFFHTNFLINLDFVSYVCKYSTFFSSFSRHGHSITKREKRVHQNDISMVSEYLSSAPFVILFFFLFQDVNEIRGQCYSSNSPRSQALLTYREKFYYLQYATKWFSAMPKIGKKGKGFATVRKTWIKQHCRRWKWYSLLYLYSVKVYG